MAIMNLFLFLLLCLISLILNTVNAQQHNSNISLGSSLRPTDINPYWLSWSAQFAFGFYPYRHGFAVGIWFNKLDQKTVVWTANRDEPPLTSNATLRLTNDGLIIVQRSREDVLVADASQTASASLLDSGNLVLYNSTSEMIWQSFNFPTDTILPGQILAPPGRLVSGVSDTDHASGRFQIIMQTDGNLVQYPVEEAKTETHYWQTQTYTAGNGVTLNLDGQGKLYLLNQSKFNIKNIASVSSEATYRATIDADGIFRLYSHTLNQSGDWSIEWSSVSVWCIPTGVCGLNSYCDLISGNNDPICKCPVGFDYIDQNQKNLGCRKKADVACTSKGENGAKFVIQELRNVSWYDAYSTLDDVDKDVCKDECFRDCNCEVALYEARACKKMKQPLRFARVISIAPGTTAFLKIKAEEERKRNRRKLPMDVFIACISSLTVAFLVVAVAGVLLYRSRMRGYKRILKVRENELVEDVTLRAFTYEELKIATNSFKDELGKGAYGSVFRGVISNGKRIVAIKRLEKVVAEGEREFKNEMTAIGKTHHRNLVQLLGYCYDGTNRLLVYEYMKNGSLADFLFKSNLKVNWDGRIEIILNIARGIFYLHEECETQIIHCDIKPENILMDDEGHAKIADFGLAKLLMPNQTRTYTGIRGTRGYVAPEWHRNMPITVKADVYSFGIMLFEIICCRRSVESDVPDDEAVLVNWVYDCFKANEIEKLVKNEEVSLSKLERMVKVGLWCTQYESSSRPSMKKVILMLEGTVNISDPPLLSSFVSSP